MTRFRRAADLTRVPEPPVGLLRGLWLDALRRWRNWQERRAVVRVGDLVRVYGAYRPSRLVRVHSCRDCDWSGESVKTLHLEEVEL